jgi:predicted nuclease with TOPRIM domain
LSEELSEVQKEISKCLRFSLNHIPEEYNDTNSNLERLQYEWTDVQAILIMLEREGINISDIRSSTFNIEKKIRRTDYYMNISKQLGTLE